LNRTIEDRIAKLAAADGNGNLAGGLKGIEKESLRVRMDGWLADTPHPTPLGSALTNQFITTDFSEALLEFVTPAHANTWETLRSLCEIHQFVYANLDNELLWVNSMPCLVGDDKTIPLAEYGKSNVGRMKNVYRNGLGYRYGRRMQTIAGVHFNYSLPPEFWPQYQAMEQSKHSAIEFRSAAYLGLVRNFRRMGWLILYLFGSSPALCKSFLGNRKIQMPMLDETTCHEPYGTSLRMSDLGYTNSTQAKIPISLNSLDDYVNALSCAICTPEPAYEKIGVKVDGVYRQLNANQLQIENEYYSPIRPKRVANSGERPTTALRRDGIEYVEIRSLDLNVFDPVGINQNAMRFTEAFLIYCLLEESPLFDDRLWEEATNNHTRTATDGRSPDFHLVRNGRKQTLKDWAREIMQDVAEVARLIDASEGGDAYLQSVLAQARLVEDPDATPSARVLQDLKQSQSGFFQFAMAGARGHKAYFDSLVAPERHRLDIYENEARLSIEKQKEIEATDALSFEDYLANYYSQDGCP
jgi:glutamate--cysteine ligase